MRSQDEEHLNILAILHYVYGGLVALGGCFPLIYVGLGAFVVSESMKPRNPGNAPPPEMGYFFIVFGLLFSLFLWAVAGLVITSGRYLSRRRNWMFCLIIAALECVNMPLGTILGVFTIIVLVRPSVKELFQGRLVPDARPNPFDQSITTR
jgi:hypothetical protein